MWSGCVIGGLEVDGGVIGDIVRYFGSRYFGSRYFVSLLYNYVDHTTTTILLYYYYYYSNLSGIILHLRIIP